MAAHENNQNEADLKVVPESQNEDSELQDGDIKGDHLQSLYSDAEHHVVECPNAGTINVFVQAGPRVPSTFSTGTRSGHEVVIFTVHDLGCNHTMYDDFVLHPKMTPIRDRTVWVHVNVPGQEPDAPDLPASFTFPTMQKLGEDLIHILDQLKIKEVICFGEGAGANILSRFAMEHTNRVLGCVLLHCTGTTAGFLESLKDKVINWKLDHIGMNPTAEAYLILHRYGAFHSAEDHDQLKNAIENYQSNLRTRTNPKNLKKFVEAFLRRTSIAENMAKKLNRCPVLFITGQKSVFNHTTRSLHQNLMKHTEDKNKVEFIEVQGIANILEERPTKIVESFQYFLQGCGLISSVPMHHISRPLRLRSMSMEEYDQPKLRCRSLSGSGSPLHVSPQKTDTSTGN